MKRPLSMGTRQGISISEREGHERRRKARCSAPRPSVNRRPASAFAVLGPPPVHSAQQDPLPDAEIAPRSLRYFWHARRA